MASIIHNALSVLLLVTIDLISYTCPLCIFLEIPNPLHMLIFTNNFLLDKKWNKSSEGMW